MFISKMFNSVIKIAFFSLIPFVWWYIEERDNESFSCWVGIKKIQGSKLRIIFTSLLTTVIFLIMEFLILYSAREIETAISEFYGLGFIALPAILIYAVFNTALPEEIVFRGFLLKRMNDQMPFYLANFIQALAFGLIHGIMLFNYVSNIAVIAITIFMVALAFVMGYINEKLAGGSIAPSWTIHALVNGFSGLCVAFMLF